MGLIPLLGLALWIRGWGLPALARHGWEGHEAEYLAVYRGTWDGAWSTRIVPLLGLLYRSLGRVTQHDQALVWLSLVLGLASIAALVVLVRRQGGPGLLAGLLVALYGNHAFWSSSAYHVIAPHALLLAALALLTVPGWWAVALSGLAMGAAAGTRLELLVFALPALLWAAGHGWGRRALWLGTTALVFIGCLLPMATDGAHPAGLWEQAPAALAANLALPVFLAPFSAPIPLLLVGGLTATALWREPRLAWPWLLVSVLGHASASAFADAGYRHALLPGVALCVLAASGIRVLWRLGHTRQGPLRLLAQGSAGLALLAIGALLALDCAEVARRYYAPPTPLIEQLRSEAPGPLDPDGAQGCTELDTSPARLPGTLGPLDVTSWDRCYTWREDWQHRRWTSLGVHDRGARMHRAFALEPLGLAQDPSDPGQPPRLLWRVHPR